MSKGLNNLNKLQSMNRKYIHDNNIYLPLVPIGNIYYNNYFLTVVSSNLICSDPYGMMVMSDIKGWINISSLANNGRQATLNIAKATSPIFLRVD